MNKKLISIILVFIFSVILWISVTLSNSYFTMIKAPIKVVNIPSGYAAYSPEIKEVQLKLKGEGWKLAFLTMSGNVEYTVSAEYDSGNKVFDLTESLGENQWLSSGIQVFNIFPERIPLKIERMFKKKVIVSADINLSFADEFGLTFPVTKNPDSVTIYGPKTIVKSINTVKTESLSLINLNKNITRRVRLKEIYGVNFDRDYISLYLNVEKIVDKEFDKIDIKIKNVPEGYSISLFPNNLKVVLRGGINTLGRMKTSDLNSYVDFNEIINDTTGTIEPIINIPEYTTIIKKEPNYLKYIIKKF